MSDPSLVIPRRGTAGGDALAGRTLDALPVPVLSLVLPADGDGEPRIAWLNHAAEEVLGRSRDHGPGDGRTLWGHLHVQDAATVQSWLASAEPRPLTTVVRVITAEGRLRSHELVARRRVDRVLGGAVMVDIVLHELAVAPGAEEAPVVPRSRPNGDVVFHLRLRPHLTVSWTNDAAPNLLGITPGELRQDAARLFRTVVPADRERVRSALGQAVEGPVAIVFDVHRGGEIVTVEMELRPVRSRGQLALVAVARRLAGRDATVPGPVAGLEVLEDSEPTSGRREVLDRGAPVSGGAGAPLEGVG